ncbi:MAG: hypothetical protein IT495_13115 [Gammaproteobacteria bacterium]|nr:hypothetical protein [Gammaproteobacteria bacterium]
MPRSRVLPAVLAGLLLAPAAGAGDNGHELLAQCALARAELEGASLEEPQSLAATFCRGFIQGVTNIVSIGYYVKPDGQFFCPPPDGIDQRDAVRVLVEYLLAHPDRLHARKVTLAAAAYMQAYPCPVPGATASPATAPEE